MQRISFVLKLLVLVLLAPLTAEAAPESVVFAQEYVKQVAVKYVMRADYIGRSVTITSDERDLASKLRNIQEAKKYLFEEISRRGQVIYHEGAAIVQPSKGYFKSNSGEEPMARVHMLLPVVRESDNIYSGGIELITLMKDLKPPGKAEFTFSSLRLGVEDPEKMRGALLEMISKEISFTQDRLKSTGKITVSGLGGPVRVAQYDSIRVILYIEYGMEIEVP